MKTPTIPTLLGPDGMTSLREYAGYHGSGSGFGGQLRAWNPPSESVDAALLPNFTRGNARADDLVRNNGYAANAIQLHQDHIVGSFFRLSHRPSWRYLGIGEEEARAFSREVEAAWKEFAEDDCCCIDVERKRTFTMMIREGVAMHAFNGELFVQATWDTSSSRLFRTQFRMVNGYSVFEQSLLRYIAAGLGVSYEQLSRNYAQMSYSTARASANESWAYFMGRRKFVASRQASQMFLCWLEEAIVRRVVTLPSKARFSFQEARSAWGNCDWIGSGRMAIDGLKEVQEAVMLIEAGLSTYEKECAKRGDDYQEIFAQQVRETMERRAAGLKPPAWAAAAFESGLRQSTEEEKSDSRAA
ncbi:phage portal protein [Escherichia coli]|uniref:phage portal protein n=1 Tax=Escherichia coli TaxID=562 RepID=UPI0038B46B77